jgi:hypothetical protein
MTLAFLAADSFITTPPILQKLALAVEWYGMALSSCMRRWQTESRDLREEATLGMVRRRPHRQTGTHAPDIATHLQLPISFLWVP